MIAVTIAIFCITIMPFVGNAYALSALALVASACTFDYFSRSIKTLSDNQQKIYKALREVD